MKLRALTGVGLATLLYKGLAAGQQLLIARVLGAGEAADAYFLAQAVPVLLAGLLFASVSTSTVFLSRDGTRDDLFGVTAFGAAGLAVVAWLVRGLLVPVEAEGLFTLLLPVLALQPVSGFLTGLLSARGRLLAPPLSMCLFYGCGLVGLTFASQADASPLAAGLSVGALLQAAVLWRLAGSPIGAAQGWRTLAAQALPALGCNAISTVLLVADRDFAAGFGAGSVASISYVYSLITMPTQLAVNTVTGVYLPVWTELARDGRGFAESLGKAAAALSVLLIPIALCFALAAGAITGLVLGSTRFTQGQIAATASLLAAFAPASLGFAAKDTLTAALLAQGRPLTAFAAGVFALAVAGALKHWLGPRMGIHAAAVGTGLGLAACCVYMLFAHPARRAFWGRRRTAF